MRDIEKEEQERINNGNRFITIDSGSGVFARDVDTLFKQYANLRWKVYRTYENRLNNAMDREDLKMYIDEQFIRLCKEYEVNGAVDFAGFIKQMLNTRVKHVFIANYYRDRDRERVGSSEEEVEVLYNDRNFVNASDVTGYVELMDTLARFISVTPLDGIERLLLDGLSTLENGSERKLVQHIAKQEHVNTRRVYKALDSLKEKLQIYVQNSNLA